MLTGHWTMCHQSHEIGIKPCGPRGSPVPAHALLGRTGPIQKSTISMREKSFILPPLLLFSFSSLSCLSGSVPSRKLLCSPLQLSGLHVALPVEQRITTRVTPLGAPAAWLAYRSTWRAGCCSASYSTPLAVHAVPPTVPSVERSIDWHGRSGIGRPSGVGCHSARCHRRWVEERVGRRCFRQCIGKKRKEREEERKKEKKRKR